MPISFENIRSEPHDMAGVGLEPDAYHVEELTPEKLITEKAGQWSGSWKHTCIDSFTNLSFLSMGLDPSRWPPETVYDSSVRHAFFISLVG